MSLIARLRDRILSFLSPTYRDHLACRSSLASLEAELAQTRAAHQTDRAALSNALSRAASLQDRLDQFITDQRWLIEQALRASQCTADWLARQTIAHAPIFGSGPEPSAPPPEPEGQPVSVGKVHGRRMASAQTAQFIADLEARYNTSRAASAFEPETDSLNGIDKL